MKKEELLNLATLFNGDNIEVIRTLPENSIDSIVTDPPYGISFMNKKWDHDVPSVEFWKEIFRVLKPGGHVLSFGGTRTYHRMVVNMEDVGFEIRDQIMWIYGSGFPKSLNIGMEVDKKLGNEREVVGISDNTRKRNNHEYNSVGNFGSKELENTKGNTPYEGWGTGLKPANEPICLARKPIEEKTITDNVLKYGTGGINIDGCRIGTTDNLLRIGDTLGDRFANFNNESGKGECNVVTGSNDGRFPSNVIMDEVAGEELGNQRKFFYCPKVSTQERNLGIENSKKAKNFRQQGEAFKNGSAITDVERNEGNNHPTIKPIELMRYLVRLVTPKGGVVMDPFMGSGSTGVAALNEDFRFVGIEMDEVYFEIAKQRVNSHKDFSEFFEEKEKSKARSKKKNPGDDPKLGFWSGRGLNMAA